MKPLYKKIILVLIFTIGVSQVYTYNTISFLPYDLLIKPITKVILKDHQPDVANAAKPPKKRQSETLKTEIPETKTFFFKAKETQGYIGESKEQPLDSPTDNMFTVTIDQTLTGNEEVYLTYELYGISDFTGVSYSINDQLSLGGHEVAFSKQWQKQSSAIAVQWLHRGDNLIRFSIPNHAPYYYKIKNVGLKVVQSDNLEQKIVINQPPHKPYTDQGGYIQGFVLGKGADQAQILIDGVTVSNREGAFEMLVPEWLNDNVWQSTVKAVYKDGTVLSQKVTFKTYQKSDYSNRIGLSKGHVRIQTYVPSQTFELSMGKARLELNETALNHSTHVSITQLRAIDLPVPEAEMINVTDEADGYRFLPHGTQFNNEVKVHLGYDPAKIPEGYTAKDIKTYFFNDVTRHWVALPKDSLITDTHVLISRTTHFTDMINGIIKVPESPETAGYTPTSIKDIKAANPSAGIQSLAPPSASQMGSATTGYQIVIPAGRNGMQPQVGIQYNSGGGNDWMGLGWNLQLPSIGIDTRWGVPRYDATNETETYSIAGQQLAPVAHRGELMPRTAEKVFHPRVEGGFNKIVRHGDNPQNYWWEVTDKGGTRYFYGGLPGSGVLNDAVLKDAHGNIAHWALVEVRDLHANFVRYHYTTVQDTGVKGGTVPGYNLYPAKITYTGHGTEEGKYEVVFTRDRELGEDKRQDVSISGRLGFKQVTADRLRKIEVKYNGTNIRHYELQYGEGAFFKTLLKTIIEYDSAGDEFTRHELEYYDDVQAENGYVPYTAEEAWQPQADDIKGDFIIRVDDFNDYASALSGNKSKSVGMALSLTVGKKNTDVELWHKMNTVGGNFGFNQSEEEGMLSLIDINGDGLPDKVYTDGSRMKFRPNQSGPDGITVFGEEKIILGADKFSGSTTNTFSYGIEANFKVFAGLRKTDTKTTIKTYFTDANGDGLLDIVDNGIVYFNHIDENNLPVFTTSSSDTPSPIIASTNGIDPNLITIDPNELENMIDQYPLHDAVRVWEAPYDGTVSIEAPVTLSTDPGSVDGVRVAIQHNGTELWQATLSNDSTLSQSPSLSAIAVNKGDRLYFRVQSIFNGEGDVVQWDPVISYALHNDQTIDANDLPLYQFKASDGFIISAQQSVGTPIDGAISIDGSFNKPITSDDVNLSIKKTDADGNIQTVWSQTYTADQTVNENIGLTDLPVIQGETYLFSVNADTNIDWKTLSWTPRLYYTASSDPNMTTVNNPDGTPMLEFFPTVNYGLYARIIQPTAVWTATQTGSITASPTIGLSGINQLLNGEVTLSIKTNNTLVTKQTLTVNAGVMSPATPLTFSAETDQEYYFDLYASNNDIADALTTAQVTLSDTGATVLDPGIATVDNTVIFGPMYRHWGQFGYNGNRDRATQPINESELTMEPDNTETIDLSGATTPEEMEQAFADQGGQSAVDAKFIMMLPDNVSQRYRGYDENNWVAATSASASRLGMDNISIDNPATSGGSGATAINKITKSFSVGFSAGVGVPGLGGVSGSASTAYGESKAITEFTDVNGDKYPDIIAENKIQYTYANGTLEPTSKSVETSYFQKSENSSTGIAVNGSPTLSKTTVGAIVPPTTPGAILIPIPFIGDVLAIKIEDAKSSLSISGSYNINHDESKHTFIDINADGLPDKVYDDGQVALNLGYAFTPREPWNFVAIKKGTGEDLSAGLGFSYKNGSVSGGIGLQMTFSHADVSLLDLNGDGLPDYYDKEQALVYLNTGHHFIETDWIGLDEVQENYNVGESANIAFTACIPIPPITPGLKVCVNPSFNTSHGAGKETVSITDLDGDGYPDYLKSKRDHELTVKRSTIGRTNLLKSVTQPLGADFVVDYTREGNTYEQPSSEWVLASVAIHDGFAGDGADTLKNTFEYEGGYYDRHEREFYGYGTVKSHQLDTENGDVVYRTAVQEFINDNYYEKGLAIREYLQDAGGNLYTESINTYELKDIVTGTTLPDSFKQNDAGVAFPAIVRSEQLFYEGQSTAQKTTAKTFGYDVIGNITDYTDFGDEGTADDISSHITYHNVADKHITGTPSEIVVTSNGTTYRKRTADINTTTGDVTRISQYLENGDAAHVDMAYDSYGNLIKITRPENAEGQRMFFDYTYDPEVHTYTTAIADAYGYSSTASYDYRYGQVLETIDLNGHPMRYTIDQVGRISTITGPYEIAAGVPYTIAFEYYPKAEVPWALTKHYDPEHPDNPIETATFIDGLSRVVQVKKDGDLYVAPQQADVEHMIVSGRLTFDSFGRTTEAYYPVAEPKGSTDIFNATYDNITPTRTTYDVLDRTLTVTLPDNAVTTTDYGFGNDRDGHVQFSTKVTDANGIWKQSFTNVRGLTKAILEQYSQGSDIWTSYAYSPINELLAVKDDQNNLITSVYDWFGRRTQVTHPDAGTSTFAYDLSGNMTSRVTANLAQTEQAITYMYDYNRLTEIHYPQNPQNNVTYTYGDAGADYNRAGRIVLQEDATGAQEFFYNELGAVVKNIRTIVVPDSETLTYATEFTYDTWNRITQMLYPDGEEVAYHYNKGGLLHDMTGVKNGNTYDYVKQLGYDKFEQRVYLGYGNGTETFYTYEPERRRLHNMVAETASDRQMMNNVYTYDKVNNILRLQNNAEIPSSNLMGGQTDYNYAYDDLYRLTRATGSHKGSNHENRYTLDMAYNSIHSITRKAQNHVFKGYDETDWSPRNQTTYTMDYAYDGTQPHAASHIGEQAYTYDANGNQTGWTHDVSGQNRRILWDEENRIRAIADNGAVFSYVYDAAGERVLKNNGGGQTIAEDGTITAGKGSIGNFTVYVNPYVVIRNSQVTKHFYIESQRIVTKLNDAKEGLLQDKAGTASVDYTAKTTNLKASILKNYADLGIEKVTGEAGNSGQTPPNGNAWGYGKEHPDNGNNGNGGNGNDGNNGGGNDPNDGDVTTNGIDKPDKFIYYYHPDHLGSSSYISNALGEVVQHIEYFAFGETFLEEHSNTDRTPYLFNGKELDEETGLYYYGARYYDPVTSVWQSVDPLASYNPIFEVEHYIDGQHNGGVFYSGNLAAYSYTYQNPLKYVDPNGKQNIPNGIYYIEGDNEENLKKFNNFMTTLDVVKAATAFHPLIGKYVRSTASSLIQINKYIAYKAQKKINHINKELNLLEKRKAEILNSTLDVSIQNLKVDQIPIEEYNIKMIEIQVRMFKDLKKLHQQDKEAAENMISGLEGFTKTGMSKSIAIKFMKEVRELSKNNRDFINKMKQYLEDPDQLKVEVLDYVRRNGWKEGSNKNK